MRVHWDVALIWVGWGLLALPVFAYYIRQVDGLINKATLVQNASSWAHKAWLLAAGWKTIILTSLAGAVQIIPLLVTSDNLQTWATLPIWVQWFNQSNANIITTVLLVGAQLAHVEGLLSTAQRREDH